MKKPISEFTIIRRHLPHWQFPGAVYFITTRCVEGKVLSDNEKDIIVSTIKYPDGKKYNLFAYVIMPDHFHLIIQPLEIDRKRLGIGSEGFSYVENKKNVNVVKETEKFYNLSEIMHGIKSFSAHKINKESSASGGIFQGENFDRVIRNKNEFYEKLNYIVNNPVRVGLVEHPGNYKWLFWGCAIQ